MNFCVFVALIQIKSYEEDGTSWVNVSSATAYAF